MKKTRGRIYEPRSDSPGLTMEEKKKKLYGSNIFQSTKQYVV